jgi:hypothetical protein
MGYYTSGLEVHFLQKEQEYQSVVLRVLKETLVTEVYKVFLGMMVDKVKEGFKDLKVFLGMMGKMVLKVYRD